MFQYWWCPEPPKATGTARKGFQPLHRGYSGVCVSVLFTAILGLLAAQEEVAVPTVPALQGPGEVLSLSPPCLACVPGGTHTALSWSQALMSGAFLSYWSHHFPLSWHLCRKRNKCSHLLRKWPSASIWLTSKLWFTWTGWTGFLNWRIKTQAKPKTKPKNHRSKQSFKLFALSSSRAWGIPEWIFFTRCFPAVECELQAGDST